MPEPTTNMKPATLDIRVIFFHVLIFISYVLCFVYLYKPNTEMVSIFLFFLLHISVIFFIISTKLTVPSFVKTLSFSSVSAWDITQMFNINFMEYSLAFMMLSWIILLFAFYWICTVFVRLYQAYIPFGKDMTFGNMEPNKTVLYKYLILSTVFIWLFYIINGTKSWFQSFMNKNKIMNSFVLIVFALSVYSSVTAFTTSRYIYDTIHTIVIPPPV
jgi:hypothetical protein